MSLQENKITIESIEIGDADIPLVRVLGADTPKTPSFASSSATGKIAGPHKHEAAFSEGVAILPNTAQLLELLLEGLTRGGGGGTLLHKMCKKASVAAV